MRERNPIPKGGSANAWVDEARVQEGRKVGPITVKFDEKGTAELGMEKRK